jgi:hypothetical protein
MSLTGMLLPTPGARMMRAPSPTKKVPPVSSAFALNAPSWSLSVPVWSTTWAPALSQGSAGTSSAAFTVPLPWPYGPQLNLPPADTADRTAFSSSGADHDGATCENLTSAAGETAKTIMVPVQGNKKNANEAFVLHLWEAGSVFLPDAQRIATILDDSPRGGKN